MDYRLTKQHLLDALAQWNRFLKRKVHLIACGGTAKNGLVILQGDHLEKVVEFLKKMGYPKEVIKVSRF